jgi:hypothetical protein
MVAQSGETDLFVLNPELVLLPWHLLLRQAAAPS